MFSQVHGAETSRPDTYLRLLLQRPSGLHIERRAHGTGGQRIASQRLHHRPSLRTGGIGSGENNRQPVGHLRRNQRYQGDGGHGGLRHHQTSGNRQPGQPRFTIGHGWCHPKR